MEVIFDYVSKKITNLKAERETYKKQYLAQKEISNSLSTQINDNHSLVTESSIVKELQAEIRGRNRFYNLSIDRRDLIIYDFEQRVVQLKQQAAGEVARRVELRLRRIDEEVAKQVELRLRRLDEESAWALPSRELTVSDCPDNVSVGR
jgi:hypothetical protein